MYVKTEHNKRKFDAKCSKVEKASDRFEWRYETRSGTGVIDFIYKNKLTHEERALRYERTRK